MNNYETQAENGCRKEILGQESRPRRLRGPTSVAVLLQRHREVKEKRNSHTIQPRTEPIKHKGTRFFKRNKFQSSGKCLQIPCYHSLKKKKKTLGLTALLETHVQALSVGFEVLVVVIIKPSNELVFMLHPVKYLKVVPEYTRVDFMNTNMPNNLLSMEDPCL